MGCVTELYSIPVVFERGDFPLAHGSSSKQVQTETEKRYQSNELKFHKTEESANKSARRASRARPRACRRAAPALHYAALCGATATVA